MPPAPGHEPGIEVEGRYFPPDHGLDEVNLHVGAHIRVGVSQAVPDERRGGPVLRVIDGPSAGHARWMDGLPAVVGRDPGADLVLTDPTLSGMHAQFEPAERGSWTVTDLGSSNGTWVDGRPATSPLTVPEDAIVRMGATHLRLTEELPDDQPLPAGRGRPAPRGGAGHAVAGLDGLGGQEQGDGDRGRVDAPPPARRHHGCGRGGHGGLQPGHVRAGHRLRLAGARGLQQDHEQRGRGVPGPREGPPRCSGGISRRWRRS